MAYRASWWNLSPFWIVILAGIALAVTAGARANGQGAVVDPAAVKNISEAAMASRGRRELSQLKYSAWRKLCFQPPEAEMVCRTTITGVVETGQEMLRVDLIERGAGKAALLQIFLPPMLFLQAGVKVAIGHRDPVNFRFGWCVSNACMAAHAVDADFIQRMKSGQEMTLEAVDAGILTVTASLPLDQFAAVNRGVPSLTFGLSLEDKRQ